MVYVDKLRSSSWRWKKSCHLFCDVGNDNELRQFAMKNGLKRKWFQDNEDFPHYDLTMSKRKVAVQMGAIEVDNKFAIKVRNERKALIGL